MGRLMNMVSLAAVVAFVAAAVMLTTRHPIYG
jgi:hypothetical protein